MTAAASGPTSPSALALSPDGRLCLVYDVAEDLLVGSPADLMRFAVDTMNSGIHAITSGQADAWAGERSFSGYTVLLNCRSAAPPFLLEWLAGLPTTFDGRDVLGEWNEVDTGDPADRLHGVEQVLAQLLTPAAEAAGYGVMLWATHVGDHRLAGVQALTTAELDNAPYDGPLPEELDSIVAAHKLVSYLATGRAWLSLQFIVRPDGSFVTSPDTESVNPWARPIPDEAWEAERKMFPAR